MELNEEPVDVSAEDIGKWKLFPPDRDPRIPSDKEVIDALLKASDNRDVLEFAKSELELKFAYLTEAERDSRVAKYLALVELVDLIFPLSERDFFRDEGPKLDDLMETVKKIRKRQNLTDLHKDPNEWVSLGMGVWVSKRNPEAISFDGGMTYKLRSAGLSEWTV